MQTFAQIQMEKGQPSVGAVHVGTALGNSGKKPNKAKDFKATLADYRAGVAKAEDDKQPKAAVDYGEGKPDQHCGICAHFVHGHKSPAACELVEGEILPDKWCKLFELRAAKRDAGKRSLRPMEGTDGKLAHTPFPHDPNVLGQLRHDQVPRFFGALTDGHKLPSKDFAHKDVVAMQDRVDPAKVQSMVEQKPGKKPVVVHVNGRDYIADGHHRFSADYLAGKDKTEAHYLDLDPVTNTVKRSDLIKLHFAKADPQERMVFGWASVAERDGVLVIDKQQDIIPVATLEKAVYDFMLFSREGDDMHVGMPKSRCIESMMFTAEKCKALNIPLPKDEQGRPMQAWWTGFYVEDDALWAAYKRGDRPEFSIGGAAVPVKV